MIIVIAEYALMVELCVATTLLPMPQRRLTAIMFSDIAGYTSMMQADEEHGKQIALTYRRILEKSASAHDGKIIQHFGDGSLTIFKSSVEALQCSREIQKTLSDLDIPLRIGVHLGDISIEGEDIFGDGVNIASRVESLGIPGSILFTRRIYEDIQSHPEFKVIKMGLFHFKNDHNPRDIYALQVEGIPPPTRDTLLKTHSAKLKPAQKRSYFVWTIIMMAAAVIFFGKILPSLKDSSDGINMTDIQSLLIFPFENFTGDEKLDYVTSGLHTSLITDIGRIKTLRVISPTSSRAYKNMEKPLPVIAKEAKVEAVIEPNVTCYGDSICLQLRGVGIYPEERQLFVKDYKAEKSQVLNLLNKICEEIAAAIDINISSDKESLFEKAESVDTAAYDLYLKGKFYLDQFDPSTINTASRYFEMAHLADKEWAEPYIGMAETGVYQLQMGLGNRKDIGPKMQANIDTAFMLDPNNAQAHYINALIYGWNEWNWAVCERSFLKSISLNPGNATCLMHYSHYLTVVNKKKEALLEASKAIDLDPLRPFILVGCANVFMEAKNYEYAIELCEKALDLEPHNNFAKAILDAAYYYNGDLEKGFEMSKHFVSLMLTGKNTEFLEELQETFENKGYYAAMSKIIELQEYLAKQGIPVYFDLAWRNYIIGDYEKAIDVMEEGYKAHDNNMPYITWVVWENLFDHPRYQVLVKKMGLPIPAIIN